MEEAERGFKSNSEDGTHDGGVKQSIAETKEGVESVASAADGCADQNETRAIFARQNEPRRLEIMNGGDAFMSA